MIDRNIGRALALAAALAAGPVTAAVQTLHPLGPETSSPRGVQQLVLATDGNLYGVSCTGGAQDRGAVFRLTTDGTLTLLASFDYANGDCPSALMQHTDGNLYGVARFGGAGRGTFFRMTLAGTLTKLHSFSFPADRPRGDLAEGMDGNLYGTTSGGNGSAYRITTAGALTLLHSFIAAEGTEQRGLTVTSAGDFVGAAFGIGAVRDPGTIFRMTADGTVTVLHDFAGPEGRNPNGGIVEGADGNFYGTTNGGGAYGGGTIYRLTPAGAYTVLHNLRTPEGRYPLGGLLKGADGAFYGLTSRGGAHDRGTFFRITAAGEFATVYHFVLAQDGWNSIAAPVEGSDIYGATHQGGPYAYGTVFKFINDVPNAFTFPDRISRFERVTEISDVVTVGGITVPVPIDVSGHATALYKINAGAWTNAPGTVELGDKVRLRLGSGTDGEVRYARLDIAGVVDTWIVTTQLDRTPAPFSFTDAVDVAPATIIDSNAITVSGITAPVSISLSTIQASARYRVNGGPWTNAAGEVVDGDTVQLRMVSGAAGTIRSARLNIGPASDTWTVTTAPQ